MLKALHGKLISTDFFQRHWKIIVLVMFMVLIYITNRYNSRSSEEKLVELRKEYVITHTEFVKERGRYMSNTRETSMQQLVDSLHLDLHIQSQPPYKLSSN